MRTKTYLEKWRFSSHSQTPYDWVDVTIPHTWNAHDGQGGDGQSGDGHYRRCACVYKTCFTRPAGQKVYICFDGVNHRAEVWCNGRRAGEHIGGYAAFTFDITALLRDGSNDLVVHVSNEPDGAIYPSTADYTFFGGIYRKAYIMAFDGPHFSMDQAGSAGVFIDPSTDGTVQVRAYTTGGKSLCASILDASGEIAASSVQAVQNEMTCFEMTVLSPKLWEGSKSPALYSLRLVLDDTDALEIVFGFRHIAVNAEEGFLLNGSPYSLYGVARHQDRENMGWAIGDAQHREDMDIICQMGANSVRFAHYQHAQTLYDLCDRRGMVAWAEIPMISEYLPGRPADDNIAQQLNEMICQLYNHPSVCFWCIANEPSIGGVSEGLVALLRRLHQEAKRLDPSRPTVVANMGATSPQSPLWHITDAVTANQYLGWYDGNKDDFGPFVDTLHDALPVRPLGLSEYGAEAVLAWHSTAPQCMDYTEEYQALLHEAAWKALSRRRWLLGVWVWNMFDFGAAHRAEGGVMGRNHKGLVTYDRKTRKDAFWFYKACWSDEPFVYITGKRFTRRAEDAIDIKVYSNQPQVTLMCGDRTWTLAGEHVFVFKDIPLSHQQTTFKAVGRGCEDALTVQRVLSPDTAYVLPQPTIALDARVTQWFADIQKPEAAAPVSGCFCMDDSMDDIVLNADAMAQVERYWASPLEMIEPAMAARLRKGGAMAPSHIWRFVKAKLPQTAYDLLSEALSQVQRIAP